jgi:hypothetical protein
MTIKKTTTKKTARRRPTIKDRARSIIADAEGYDEGTRKSIQHMLATNAADLAECVADAEAGVSVYDLSRIDKEQAEAAAALVKLLDLPGLPDFLSSGLHMMLAHAARARRMGIATETEDGSRYSVEALADLFAVTAGIKPGLAFEPTKDVAELISAIIKHPDLDDDLRYEFGCVVTDHITNSIDTDSPRVIRAMLEQYKAEGDDAEEGGAS